MKKPFEWDGLSDQPHVITDRKFKKSLKKIGFLHYIKSFFVTLLTLPVVLLVMGFFRQKPNQIKGLDFTGLCVNLDREPALTPELLKDLAVKKVVVRIPMWDCDNLDAYQQFCQSLSNVDIMFCVLQDREHVTNSVLLKKNMHRIFTVLSPISQDFQIGNAVNRLKWGFVSVEESLRFFLKVKNICDKDFKQVKLIGSCVIDFEPISTVRSVFHFFNAKADAMAALLYVDRRGAPENTQGWLFDFKNKIRFVYASMRLSPKIANTLYITEINWPLKDKLGYAPAKGECTVSEDDAAMYLTRSYLLAWATGQVATMYWHQLIAPGYGLIDNRGSEIRRMPAYYAFKTLTTLLSHAQVTRYKLIEGVHHLSCSAGDQKIEVKWLNHNSDKRVFNRIYSQSHIYSHLGHKLNDSQGLLISKAPIFEVSNTH